MIPGRGVIDYATYLIQLSQLPTDAPLMLEHLTTAEQYAEGQAHLRRIAAQQGLALA